MNCLAIRYEDEILVIDAGLLFPDPHFWGVDIIVPDFQYLKDNRDKVRALILTHSHEDHIGSVPFLLKAINVPVYATPYTAAVLASKLDEHDLLDEVLIHTVRPKELVELDPFEIEFIRVSHSTTDCAALAIRTPVGVIIHTGDFKFDETPVCGQPIDTESLRRYGDQGVLALLSDSTNVERPGRMYSERDVIPALENIFDSAQGRIIVSCFTSSIHRIQIILDLAETFHRRVTIIGRSMIRNIDTAESMRYLDVPDSLLITPADTRRFAPHQVVMLVTGCQGEPMSALSRMAVDSHKQAKIEAGDTVVLSARQIPGNEKSISRLINHLYKRHAQVYDSTSGRIHVSGHGSQEDLKMMLEATRPKFFIPIHGEYRQLYQHKKFACSLGYKPEQVLLVESGDVIEIEKDSISVPGKIPIGRTYIDSTGIGKIEDIVVRDRKHLAYDGIIVPIITINKSTGKIENEPEIITKGFNIPYDDENDYLTKLSTLITQTIISSEPDERRDEALIKEKVRLEIKRFVQRRTGYRPTIIPVILEV
ncbi:MAG: ribonuclease J [Acidobacteria bacterium]|nr:ribonuclease J [Acidobacteriota bacterium]